LIGILFRATGERSVEADVARDPLKRQWPPGLSVSSAPKPSEDTDDSSRRSDPSALLHAPGSSDSVPFNLRQLPAGITVQRAGVSAASPDSLRLADDDEVEMEDEEEYDDDDLVNEEEGEEDPVDGATLEGAEEGEEEELEILDTVTPVRAVSLPQPPASAEVPDSVSRVLDTMQSSPASPQDSGAAAAGSGLSPTAPEDRSSNDAIVVGGSADDFGVVAADVLPGEEKAREQQLLLPEIPATGQLVESTADEDVMMMDLGK